MKIKKTDSFYSDLFDHVLLLENMIRYEKNTSPTIAELAMMIGYSEELILECLEFGRSGHTRIVH
ncbi:hypothetical protein N0O92_15830 [Alkalihalobacillus sp. MEB130]|uniref:hypothetical protein n=1 Tax=Alkalihalobacillus sp. MEB130 TaxID=2976704 RepID=UPI0028E02863|nr:hypothetical protein [Alkalihalobacillus sp. MEB130]MDT8861688.1 hypothetical protein [Alkalihalobacillus sp. MEB130]